MANHKRHKIDRPHAMPVHVYRIKGVICIQTGDIKDPDNHRLYITDVEADRLIQALFDNMDGRKVAKP